METTVEESMFFPWRRENPKHRLSWYAHARVWFDGMSLSIESLNCELKIAYCRTLAAELDNPILIYMFHIVDSGSATIL